MELTEKFKLPENVYLTQYPFNEVWAYSRKTDTLVKIFKPNPKFKNWSWNIDPEGEHIVFFYKDSLIGQH